MKKIFMLNGPNLNSLGNRQPHLYGKATLKELEDFCVNVAQQNEILLEPFQTNWEGQAIEAIYSAARDKIDFILINPAAWTHYNVALLDCLLSVDIPYAEVHLTNISNRPDHFRRQSLFKDKSAFYVEGEGFLGYKLAIEFISNKI